MPTKVYNQQTDFTFDTDDFEFDSGVKLKLQDVPGQDFTEDFADDTGFTYDSNLIEFSSGQMQQKDQRPSGCNAYAKLDTSEDLNWPESGKTGTLLGTAAISGSWLDLGSGGELRYSDADQWWPNTNNALTIEFEFEAPYTGVPPHSYEIYENKGSGNNNRIFFRHRSDSGGVLQWYFYDSVGVLLATGFSLWSPVAGNIYKFSLRIDAIAGTCSIYIDSGAGWSLFDSDTFASTTINNTGVDVGLGGMSSDGEGKIRNFQVYNYVKTSAFSAPTNETIYVAANAILPEMEFTGDGTLVSFDSFTTTEGGSPRYTLQIGRSGNYLYWTGSAWATSDGTYTQATSVADFNTNCGSLLVNGEVYGQFKVHYDNSNSQSSNDELTASLTAELYPTSNPSNTTNPALSTQGYTSLAIVSTEDANDYLKHTIEVDGQEKYWDGDSWENSSGYAQSNTTTELTTNISSLDLSIGVDAYIKTYHHSNNGTGRPALTSITVVYDFYAGTVDDPDETVVYGFCKNKNGTALSGVQVYAELTNSNAIYDEDVMLFNYPDLSSPVATSNANGYWDTSLIETENQDGTKWLITFVHNGKSKTYEVDVPHPDNTDDGTSVDFADLVMASQL